MRHASHLWYLPAQPNPAFAEPFTHLERTVIDHGLACSTATTKKKVPASAKKADPFSLSKRVIAFLPNSCQPESEGLGSFVFGDLTRYPQRTAGQFTVPFRHRLGVFDYRGKLLKIDRQIGVQFPFPQRFSLAPQILRFPSLSAETLNNRLMVVSEFESSLHRPTTIRSVCAV